MQQRIYENKYWVSTLSIDSYEDGVPKGRMSNPFYEQPQSFDSLTQFLKLMECTLDLTKLPQSFTVRRSFEPSPGYVLKGPNKEPRASGKLATFSLCIRFRQNSSWQGSLQWLEEGKRQSFRSALELIILMDNALQTAARRQEGAEENTA